MLVLPRSAVKKTHLIAIIRTGARLSFTRAKKTYRTDKIAPVPELLDKRLLIVTGKGGVGKSTVALALGLHAAAQGKRTIVAEVSAQEQLSRVFHRAEVGFHEVEMADDLWAISVDPDESIKEYLLIQLKVKAMRDMLVNSRIFSYLAAATPGLRELVTFGKVWELAQPERRVKKARQYDLVIVDAPATGHGVGFLQTPRTFANIARVGPIRSQAETLDRYITNHRKTGVVIVALPEEMPVNESASLEQTLTDEVGTSVDRIYMNGLYPERFSAAEVERLEPVAERDDGAVRAAARAAVVQARRGDCQREQLDRLRELTSAPLKTLPFLFEPQLGLEQLRSLADEIGRVEESG
jgi:anion-transporting  ArsA/GET3 family ATPase